MQFYWTLLAQPAVLSDATLKLFSADVLTTLLPSRNNKSDCWTRFGALLNPEEDFYMLCVPSLARKERDRSMHF